VSAARRRIVAIVSFVIVSFVVVGVCVHDELEWRARVLDRMYIHPSPSMDMSI
jgi:hypothetical protein